MNLLYSLFSPTKRVVLGNTISQLLGRAVGAISTLLITLVVARSLGVTGYGDFVKVTTYIAFFYLLADFGINAIYIQDSRDPRAWPTLMATRTLGGVALVGVACVLLLVLPGGSTSGYGYIAKIGILLYSPTILFQGWITTANAIFQKKLRYDLATWAVFFGSFVSVLMIIVFVFLRTNTNALVAISSLLVGSLISAIASLLFALRLERQQSLRISSLEMKRLLVSSLPLGLTLLFNLVYFRADSIVLTLTRSTAEVGIYGLAYKVFELTIVFPTFFMNAVYPLMVSSRGGQLKKIIGQSAIFLFFVSIFASVVVWLAAPLLTFIKSDFTASIPALRVLVLGLPFFFVSSVTMWALIAQKKQSMLAAIYGASMMVNVLLNIVFIPSRGYMAAAWITVFCEGVVLAASSAVLAHGFATHKRRGI